MPRRAQQNERAPKRTSKPKGQRKQGSNAALQVRTRIPHPYLTMVSNPRSTPHLVQFPDGSQEPSFVYRHKQIATFKPDSTGAISFVVIPGVLGGLAFREGTACTLTIPKYTGASTLSTTANVVHTFVSAAPTASYFIVNYPANLATSNTSGEVGNPSLLAFQASKFRVLGQEVLSTFTGSTLVDSGSALVTKYNLDPKFSPTTTYSTNGVAVNPILVAPTPGTASAISSNGTTELFTARTPLKSILGNPDPVFQPVGAREIMLSSSTLAPAYVQPVENYNDTTVRYSPSFSVDPGVAPVSYFYSGLDTSASITVEVTTIIEYGVAANSSVGGLARPNPPLSRKVADVLGTMFSALPPAQTVMNGIQGAASFAMANRMLPGLARRALPMLPMLL